VRTSEDKVCRKDWCWSTDREVLPGCARVRTKYAEKTGVGL